MYTPVALNKARLTNNKPQPQYDLLTTPITNDHFRQRAEDQLASYLLDDAVASKRTPTRPFQTSETTRPLIVPPLTPRDSALSPGLDVARLICVASSWTDICSPDPLIADFSRQILKLEVSYAAFCGLPYLIIPGPQRGVGAQGQAGLIYYARAVLDAIGSAPFMQISIGFDLVDEPGGATRRLQDLAREEYVEKKDVSKGRDDMAIWEAWDVIRTICKHSSRLGVALSLSRTLPAIPVQCRWASEPVRFITIPSSTFVDNAKGYPVLPQSHQVLLSRLMRIRPAPWVILSGVGSISDVPTSSSKSPSSPSPPRKPNPKHHPSTAHLSYLRHLERCQPSPTPIEDFGDGFQDYLQVPLQPLADNLESITYEGFEKDPVKYAWYERAIAAALRDWAAEGKPKSSGDGRVVVAVAGAGRGPLVTRALRASEETGVPVDMWLIEKNTNAYLLLQRHNEEEWGGHVKLVRSDMRSWKGPCRVSEGEGEGEGAHYPVDILVSELLGSFGDNELSPECLDGVSPLLAPLHGISIPSSYSAHLTPISTPRLHADIKGMTTSNPAAPETPYVVLLHAYDNLSTTPDMTPIVKTAWSFSHPNPHATISPADNAHNARQTTLTFPTTTPATCHGFAGYFEAVLYRDVHLSTNPVTMPSKSKDMLSWFPIYFPLRTPLCVPGGAEIEVSMFRQTDGRKVWYEWVAGVWQVQGGGKDGKGRRGRVGMSELHSSVKEGCLM